MTQKFYCENFKSIAWKFQSLQSGFHGLGIFTSERSSKLNRISLACLLPHIYFSHKNCLRWWIYERSNLILSLSTSHSLRLTNLLQFNLIIQILSFLPFSTGGVSVAFRKLPLRSSSSKKLIFPLVEHVSLAMFYANWRIYLGAMIYRTTKHVMISVQP